MQCDFQRSCGKFMKGGCSEDDIFCIRQFKISTLQELALLTPDQRRYVSLRLDADKVDLKPFNLLKNIEKNIEEFVNKGDNLYLYSNICGNGKTRWALRLMNTYFENIWAYSDLTCRGLFINVPRFLLALKDNISQKSTYIQHIKDNILNADLVIWDEIGSKGLTVFENENVLSLINSRIDLAKANIYTSNLQPEELRDAVGDRLYSRVFNMSKYKIELFGADKRGLE